MDTLVQDLKDAASVAGHSAAKLLTAAADRIEASEKSVEDLQVDELVASLLDWAYIADKVGKKAHLVLLNGHIFREAAITLRALQTR